jgi:hypothetical protein
LAQEKWSGDDGVRGSLVEEWFCCRGDRLANADIGLEVLTPRRRRTSGRSFSVDSGVRKKKKKTQGLYCQGYCPRAGKRRVEVRKLWLVRRTAILIVLSRDSRRRCRGCVGDADIELEVLSAETKLCVILY